MLFYVRECDRKVYEKYRFAPLEIKSSSYKFQRNMKTYQLWKLPFLRLLPIEYQRQRFSNFIILVKKNSLSYVSSNS